MRRFLILYFVAFFPIQDLLAQPKPLYSGYYQLMDSDRDIRLILEETQQFYYFMTSEKYAVVYTGYFERIDSFIVLHFAESMFERDETVGQKPMISHYKPALGMMDDDSLLVLDSALSPIANKHRNDRAPFIENENHWANNLLDYYNVKLLLNNNEALHNMRFPFHLSYDSLIGNRLLMLEDVQYFDDTEEEIHRLNGGMSNWKVVYPLDSSFKIFSISGEGCGAHCNGAYSNFIQFSNGTWSEILLGDLSHIYKVYDSLYLLCSEGWGGGTMSGTGVSIKLYRLDGHQLLNEKLQLAEDSLNVAAYLPWDYEKTAFSVWSYWYMPCGPSMYYSPETGKIVFQGDFAESNEIPEDAYRLLPDEVDRSKAGVYCIVGSCQLTKNKLSDCELSIEFTPQEEDE